MARNADRRQRDPNAPREDDDALRERIRKRQRDRDWQRLVEGDDVQWSPWLLLRYKVGDIGARSIPAGAAFYLAPDVSVEVDGAVGLIAHAGKRNYLHATLFNFGAAPSVPTQVDFYWADPSLGMGKNTMHHIGREWVEVKSIFQGGGALDVRCNAFWIPEVLNKGHECVQVHCSNPLFDPIEQPFSPRLDRHVAQRNLTVSGATAGATMQYNFKINHPWQWMGRTSIRARVERLALARGAATPADRRDLVHALANFGEPPADDAAELRARFHPGTQEFATAQHLADLMTGQASAAHTPALMRTRGAPPSVRVHVRDGSRVLRSDEPDRSLGNEMLGAAALAAEFEPARAFPQTLVEDVALQPLEQREIEVELGMPQDARPDEFMVFHIAQFMDRLLVGGYAVVVKIE